VTYPIALTEPLCFCHVGGCRPVYLTLLIRCGESEPDRETGLAAGRIGGTKMAVGGATALCEPMVANVSPGTYQ